MVELEDGIRRVTFELPFGIDHVHCYLLRAASDGWILVDTGLGTRDPEARWRPVLDRLDAPVELIVVTHMHPDHVGGARDAAAVTGAPVAQGREDHAQCVRAWGRRDPNRFADHWRRHGMPEAQVESVVQEAELMLRAVHWVEEPTLLDADDRPLSGLAPGPARRLPRHARPDRGARAARDVCGAPRPDPRPGGAGA